MGAQVQLIHESGHMVTANLDALTVELAPDLLDAVDTVVVAVDVSDLK